MHDSVQPLVSVLVNNYNYARYLGQAIDSALGQTYPHVEVVVVDDGSTDDSRDVIAAYGDRIVPVLKSNGGQASAFNAGFAACQGELICLLDADDVFYPTKVERVAAYMQEQAGSDILVSHDLDIVDEGGAVIGRMLKNPELHPDYSPPKKNNKKTPQPVVRNYYAYACLYRYVPYPVSTTSGVTLTRSLVEKICPLPEGYPSGADNFLVRAAALLGEIHAIDDALSRYRTHGENRYWAKPDWKPSAFWSMEEQFLNERLVQHGKRPIIARERSMLARDRYLKERRWIDLYRLAAAVPSDDLNLRTLRFGVNTVRLTSQALLSHQLDTIRRYRRG